MVHDVMSESLARRALVAGVRRERWYARLMVARARRREPRLLNAADVGWVFSGKDRSLLADLGVRVPLHVLDPPLHVPRLDPGHASAPSVLFTGYMRRTPNFEGALWFLDHVWPAVARRVPGARFVLAGADPPSALRARAGPTVHVTGFVEDLDPWYRAARVFVAPLHSGAGLKFKVPQAMLYGLPVVATPVAAEGIVERSGHGAFGVVTHDPRAMAQTLVELLEDPRRARAIGARARAWALAAHDFEAGVERVLATYRELSRRASAG
jgi:glycosyltransferase involved in cell wall biosynthesis